MSRSRAVAALFVLAVVSHPAPAIAEALGAPVEEAVALYGDLRYDDARFAFERALALEGNGPDDFATIHLYLGLFAGAQDQPEEAFDHFSRALAIDSSLELPSGQPPKITEPFDRARRFWDGATLALEHEPPEGWVAQSPAQLRFSVVDDRLEMVTGARLFVRSEVESPERTYLQEGPGPYAFPLPSELLEEAGTIRYRVELIGADSAVLRVLDDPERLAVEVAPPPLPPPVIDPPPPIGDAGLIQPPSPLYERWWFWTIIGALVVGATGTIVAFSVPGEGVDFGSPEVVR